MPPRRPRCPDTPDLLGWTPPDPVIRFDERRIRAATISGTVSRAVSAALRDCAEPREEIAARMSAYLGEAVSTNMVNAYAAEGRDGHRINLPRFAALVHATGDTRLLQVIPELFGLVAVERRWLAWIEIGQIQEQREELGRALDAARRNARRPGC